MNMDIQHIDKINFSVSSNVTIFLVSFVVPGFLFWYAYEPALFERLDFFKLLMLSVAVCLPTFLINFGTTALMQRGISHSYPDIIELWGAPVDWYVRHGFNNAINLYTIVFFMWLFDLRAFGVACLFLSFIAFNFLLEVATYKMFLKRPSTLWGVWLVQSSPPVSKGD